MVATAVLAGDAVNLFHVDGVGSAEGRLQLGAAGNAAEHGSHRQVIGGVTGIVVKASPDSLVVFPNPLPSALSSRLLSIGMECIAMHSIPIHSIVNAFHRNGIHTIGMDTNGVDVHGVAAAGGRVAGTTQPFPWRIDGKTAARAETPAPVRAAKQPLAHVRSLRDNYAYRAAFTPQITPEIPLLEILHDHHRGHTDRPPPAGRHVSPAGRRPGSGRRPYVRPLRQHPPVYGTQWRLFESWCGDVDLRSMPAEPLTVARYLAVRAGSGASIATLRLATSAIAKVHEWAGHDSPGRDRGVREALKGWGRRLARPQRQAGALTADVLAVIRLTAPKPRARGRGFETAEQAAKRARFDLALVAVLSDGGVASQRGGGADLGRRAALGRWQRPRHRDSLQDRRGSPGRRGGHHPRGDARTGRHPAGGRWW